MSAFQEYFVDTITQRYADFENRASRSEYWYFALFSGLIFIGLILLTFLGLGSLDDPSYLGLGAIAICSFAYIIPAIAITVRRLHDTNKSGWWYLISFVPGGSLVIFIFTLLESDAGRNRFGDNPWELDDGSAYYSESDVIDDI